MKTVIQMYNDGIITQNEVVIRLVQEAVNRSPAEIAKGLRGQNAVWLGEVGKMVREGTKLVCGMEVDAEKETKLYNDGLNKWTEWFGFPKIPDEHKDWIGREVTYKSGSGKEYVAVVYSIPLNPDHGYTKLPTVSLHFKNNRGKTVTKQRVMPGGYFTTQVWYPYPEGRQLWKDGKFCDI